MKLVLYTAACTGNAKNCSYPHRAEVQDAAQLKEAVRMDHVCAEYAGNYRSVDNFLRSNVLVMDCDNTHSEDPADWITPEKLEGIFPDTAYALAPSRHHMVPKNGKAARPKFHVYFEISEITDASAYAALKRAVFHAYPFFDGNALDAGRFLFGADAGETVWHEGWTAIDELVEAEPDEESADEDAGAIPQGQRNNAMSLFAGKVLKRYGETEKARQVFLEHAQKCDPPLDEGELKTIWHSAVGFYRKKVKNGDGYVPPEKYNEEFAAASLKPDDYSDIGQAKVLCREYGEELAYTDATEYLRYDGTHWAESKQMAVGACEEFLDLQLQDALDEAERCADALVQSGLPKDAVKSGGKALEKLLDGEKQRKLFYAYLAARQYLAFVMKRRDMKYVVSALQAAKPMLLMDIRDFDSQEFLLNTPSGTYDLRRGMDGRMEHRAEDYITKITAVSPSDKNRKLWMDAVDGFFCHDRELAEYVQMIAGLAAVGKVYVEALIIAYGGGSNGKSTFWNTVSRVLGSYSGSLSADALTVGCKRNVKPEMAELKGKRLVIAAELEEGMRLNTATVKQLCATDEISGEKKYKDPFKYIPTHTLVLYTNHLPKVGANDDGTWRRLIVIPFNAKIEGRADIKNYADYLVQNAGGAVLAWIIEGARKAYEADFHIRPPKCVQEAVSRYRENNDWLAVFIEDCCETDPAYTQKSGEFYQEYRAYCLRTGEYARSTTDFYAGLEAAGFFRKKTRTGTIVYGLRLKSDFMD